MNFKGLLGLDVVLAGGAVPHVVFVKRFSCFELVEAIVEVDCRLSLLTSGRWFVSLVRLLSISCCRLFLLHGI